MLRLDALGDTLLTTPAVQVLLEQVPGVDLLAFTHPAGSAVMRTLCSVAEVSVQDSWRAIAAKIKVFRPDAVLCCSEKRRAALACWASGAPLRVGFDPGWSQPLKSLSARVFFHRTVPFENDRSRAPSCHETERYVRIVEAALQTSGLETPALSLHPPASTYARHTWLKLRGTRVGVQLTAKWCRFGYTVQHLRSWVDQLPGPKVGFVAPAEESWARRSFPELRVFCTAELDEYATWVQQVDVLVTVDTGAAHVAAALQVPVVDVFPECHHEHCVARWKPWRCPHRVVLQPAFSAESVQRVGSDLGAAVLELLTTADDG